MSLKGLIYISDKTIKLSKDEYKNLVDRAAEKNKRLGLTGFICELEDRYLQYLEGLDQYLMPLMETIRFDERHENIKESDFEIEERQCSEWSMVAVPVEMVGAVHFGHLVETVLRMKEGSGFKKEEIQKMVKKLLDKWIKTQEATKNINNEA